MKKQSQGLDDEGEVAEVDAKAGRAANDLRDRHHLIDWDRPMEPHVRNRTVEDSA